MQSSGHRLHPHFPPSTCQQLNDDQWAVAVHLHACTCVNFKHVLLKPDQARPGRCTAHELLPRSHVMEVRPAGDQLPECLVWRLACFQDAGAAVQPRCITSGPHSCHSSSSALAAGKPQSRLVASSTHSLSLDACRKNTHQRLAGLARRMVDSPTRSILIANLLPPGRGYYNTNVNIKVPPAATGR
jgi:hypothetical protein